MVPKLLEKMGFENVHIVAEQAVPNGNFPTVQSPNPEEKPALQMAIDLAEKTNAQWVLGTDPDADRVGLCVRDHNGKMALLNGNQTGALLAYYQLQQSGTHHASGLPYFTARTIVTSTLIEEIATAYGVPCYSTLTGFKYIAAVIREKEGKEKFLCGGEESYGYLIGDDVRDKDAVLSAAALSEIGAWTLSQGSSLWGMLMEIYSRFGLYHEELVSITLKGLEGMQKIKDMMDNYRQHPPQQLGGVSVTETRDYLKQTFIKKDGTTGTLDLPPSNVMQFVLEDGSTITARPSGTEPKIKFYFSMKENFEGQDAYAHQVEKLKARMKQIELEMIG
jgi:phosphoglucomutase